MRVWVRGVDMGVFVYACVDALTEIFGIRFCFCLCGCECGVWMCPCLYTYVCALNGGCFASKLACVV